MADSQLESLARAYIELVNLQRQGATQEATVLYHRIARDLRGAAEGTWAKALTEFAAGDHYGAIASLDIVLHVHRQNLINLELSVSRAAVYEQIGRVLAATGQATAAAVAHAMAARGGESFYRPVQTCQIPILGGLYEHLFGERTDGTFVEVGAYDGDTFSNTSCLADLGWRGLYIEPIERSCRRCAERHSGNPRVTVLNTAIGPTETTIKFWDNGQFSTGSADEMDVNRINGWFGGAGAQEVEVRQMRLDRALTEAGIAPGFELLVVDVDGMEEHVFQSFDLAQWRPRCMIVELIEVSRGFVGHDRLIASAARVRAMIDAAGYETIYRDQGNSVFRLTAGA